MEYKTIEELIKYEFLKRDNFKHLPSYKTYKLVMKFEDINFYNIMKNI